MSLDILSSVLWTNTKVPTWQLVPHAPLRTESNIAFSPLKVFQILIYQRYKRRKPNLIHIEMCVPSWCVCFKCLVLDKSVNDLGIYWLILSENSCGKMKRSLMFTHWLNLLYAIVCYINTEVLNLAYWDISVTKLVSLTLLINFLISLSSSIRIWL